jgi:hypothetical protein
VKILVIGSCTNKKNATGFRSVLSRPEVDGLRLSGQLGSASLNGRPARDLYTGQQHRQMIDGVDIWRKQYGADSCTVKIVSAAYGLVDEDQPLLPYEVTFNEKGVNARGRGRDLGIASSIQENLRGFSIVFFLLGKEYLKSVHSPIVPSVDQKLVFFAPPGAQLPTRNPILIPTISAGSGNIAIKGRSFKWLAIGMAITAARSSYLAADTAEKINMMIEIGRTA